MKGCGKVILLTKARQERQISQETVDLLERALAAAKAGALIGLVGGFIFEGSHQEHIVGAAWLYPTLCRGICDNISDQLYAIQRLQPPQA